MNLLIVDDEPDARDTLRDVFEDEGYAVAIAANGAEALARLQQCATPVIVILDLIMPVMTGNELWEAMQAHPIMSCCPVIIVTSDPSRAPKGLVTLCKPIDLETLITKVATLSQALAM